MTPEQITLVQETMKKIVFKKDELAEHFYNRLFELRPDTRKLFKVDMADQRQKLMSTLALAVSNLRDLSGIELAVKQLGARHVKYGVKPADYADVGKALLETLEKNLGDDFTPAVREAWTAVYVLVSNAMLAGAQSARS